LVLIQAIALPAAPLGVCTGLLAALHWPIFLQRLVPSGVQSESIGS
jgi:hypothetical protein